MLAGTRSDGGDVVKAANILWINREYDHHDIALEPRAGEASALSMSQRDRTFRAVSKERSGASEWLRTSRRRQRISEFKRKVAARTQYLLKKPDALRFCASSDCRKHPLVAGGPPHATGIRAVCQAAARFHEVGSLSRAQVRPTPKGLRPPSSRSAW